MVAGLGEGWGIWWFRMEGCVQVIAEGKGRVYMVEGTGEISEMLEGEVADGWFRHWAVVCMSEGMDDAFTDFLVVRGACVWRIFIVVLAWHRLH